jgi:hypothetical protein
LDICFGGVGVLRERFKKEWNMARMIINEKIRTKKG